MTVLANHTPCCQHQKYGGYPDENTNYSSERCLLAKNHEGQHYNDNERWYGE